MEGGASTLRVAGDQVRHPDPHRRQPPPSHRKQLQFLRPQPSGRWFGLLWTGGGVGWLQYVSKTERLFGFLREWNQRTGTVVRNRIRVRVIPCINIIIWEQSNDNINVVFIEPFLKISCIRTAL